MNMMGISFGSDSSGAGYISISKIKLNPFEMLFKAPLFYRTPEQKREIEICFTWLDQAEQSAKRNRDPRDYLKNVELSNYNFNRQINKIKKRFDC